VAVPFAALRTRQDGTEMVVDRRVAAHPVWRLGRVDLTLDRPFVFGIVNVTPDSFSDGGRLQSVEAAVEHVAQLIREGAHGVDIGGESTRPHGAAAVSAEEELQRVVPVLREVRARFDDLIISVDTTKSDVAAVVLAEGADVVNDVSGLRLDPRLGDIVAASSAGLVLMHSRGNVSEMGTYRYAEYSADVVGDVLTELHGSIQAALGAGVSQDRIVVDPGIGFAKRTEHSLAMLAELERLCALGFPVLVGASRKRFVGELTGVSEPSDRVFGTVGANVAALLRGARLFRVHDVAANRQALDVAWGILATDVSRGRPSSQFPVPGSQ